MAERLLVVVVDVDKYSWMSLDEKNPTIFCDFVAELMLFFNAYTSLEYETQLAVIGSNQQFFYPNVDFLKRRNHESQIASQYGAKHQPKPANVYRPFVDIKSQLLHSFKQAFQPVDPSVNRDQSNLAGSLSLALCCKFSRTAHP